MPRSWRRSRRACWSSTARALESLIDAQPRIVYEVMCAIVRAAHRVQARLSVQAVELMNYVFKQHGRY